MKGSSLRELDRLIAMAEGYDSKLRDPSYQVLTGELQGLQRSARYCLLDCGLNGKNALGIISELKFELPEDKIAAQEEEHQQRLRQELATLAKSLRDVRNSIERGLSQTQTVAGSETNRNMPGKEGPRRLGRVVILTALSVEYKAVRAHLRKVREETHPRETVYEKGEYRAMDGSVWEVCIAEIGAGNSEAARETERVISHFSPEIVLFVGVAGGLKDVSIGDVVVATKVYGYESGKAMRTFNPRPQVHETAYGLQQRARAEARRDEWGKHIARGLRRGYKILVGPIASGDKVVASRRSTFFRFLNEHYGDALAVEMEGWGCLDAVHASHDVRGLIVRGISDLIDRKSKADRTGSQALAARHASAFAFQVLSSLARRPETPMGSPVDESAPLPEISNGHVSDARSKPPSPPAFVESPQIDELIRDVRLGNYRSTVSPALTILSATDARGENALFQRLLDYQDCPDEDTLWKALPTIEACAEFAPYLFDHTILSRMANHPNFSVRSAAASICMTFAQYAPARAPVDLLIKLSVYDEDWYVESPANAALKAMARSMPAVLQIFFVRLRSSKVAERAHAAHCLADIAENEPEILDPEELGRELAHLEKLGDGKAARTIAKVFPKVRRASRVQGYKYGL